MGHLAHGAFLTAMIGMGAGAAVPAAAAGFAGLSEADPEYLCSRDVGSRRPDCRGFLGKGQIRAGGTDARGRRAASPGRPADRGAFEAGPGPLLLLAAAESEAGREGGARLAALLRDNTATLSELGEPYDRVGRRLSHWCRSGTLYGRWNFEADGSVGGFFGPKGNANCGAGDSGRWRVDGERLCIRWSTWFGGGGHVVQTGSGIKDANEEECYVLRREGARYVLENAEGAKVARVALEREPPAAAVPVDTTLPEIRVAAPAPVEAGSGRIRISGLVGDDGSPPRLRVDGRPAPLFRPKAGDPALAAHTMAFAVDLPAEEAGERDVIVEACDAAGNCVAERVRVQVTPPVAAAGSAGPAAKRGAAPETGSDGPVYTKLCIRRNLTRTAECRELKAALAEFGAAASDIKAPPKGNNAADNVISFCSSVYAQTDARCERALTSYAKVNMARAAVEDMAARAPAAAPPPAPVPPPSAAPSPDEVVAAVLAKLRRSGAAKDRELPVLEVKVPEKVETDEAALVIGGLVGDDGSPPRLRLDGSPLPAFAPGSGDASFARYVMRFEIEVERRTAGLRRHVLEACDAEGNCVARKIEVKVVEANRPSFRGRNYALVIGNNSYEKMPDLKTAAGDAEAVAAVLGERYAFDAGAITLLVNADRATILGSLQDLRRELTPDDRLMIYYAGHGQIDAVTEEGFWLPVDADPESDYTWISNADIRRNLKGMPAKHVLVVADSCFSGTLTRSANATRNIAKDRFFIEIDSRVSRKVITSGGTEPVADAGGGGHSVFANYFLKALRENDRPYITSFELFNQLARAVANNSRQTPAYGTVVDAGDEGNGDFTFILRR